MTGIVLAIANRRYSSWSLRAWLALKAAGVPFREDVIFMRKDDTRARMLAYGPTGLVPVLKQGDLVIWESLAIIEHVAESHPALWPADPVARAHCRATATEMHGGFLPVRKLYPMDVVRDPLVREPDADAQAAIDRITTLWREARQRFGSGGPYLYGRFSVADCMYAPVATRFRTFGVKVDPVSAAYVDAIHADPLMREWIAAARLETETIDY
jgi:glutathione S-transferase